MDQEIIDFIKQNQVANICCVEDNKPYCFSCFYAPMNNEGYLVFKSSLDTRHADILEQYSEIAGTILPNELDPLAIRGIQFEGIAKEEDVVSLLQAATSYYIKYPMALTMSGKLWVVEIRSLKFTDNTKGFGYKNSWKK